jgi:hypothetical protein
MTGVCGVDREVEWDEVVTTAPHAVVKIKFHSLDGPARVLVTNIFTTEGTEGEGIMLGTMVNRVMSALASWIDVCDNGNLEEFNRVLIGFTIRPPTEKEIALWKPTTQMIVVTPLTDS